MKCDWDDKLGIKLISGLGGKWYCSVEHLALGNSRELNKPPEKGDVYLDKNDEVQTIRKVVK